MGGRGDTKLNEHDMEVRKWKGENAGSMQGMQSCSLTSARLKSDSVASRLQNCGNPTKYIYWPHKWKANAPICPQKMRTARSVSAASSKKFETSWLAEHCLVLLFRQPTSLYKIEVQYVFTIDLICMHYLCVSVIHRTLTWTTGSVICLHNLLMHAYTDMFAFVYSVRLNGCLFHGGGAGFGPLFSFKRALRHLSVKF